MRVLVIGGSGFIGTRLIEQLLGDGHTVVNLDRRPSGRYPDITTIGDVTDGSATTAAATGCDAVVVLAAEHRDDVRPLSRYTQVNVGGAEAVIAAVTALGIDTVVFTSSVAVYGLGRTAPDESAEPAPFNEYGRTKLAAEKVLIGWAQADPARSLTIVRPSVVFGEGNRGNVYTLARQIASGRFLFVGSGANRKSMSYVGNVAAFLATGLDRPPGVHLTNYADRPDLTTRELVETLRRLLGKGSGRGASVPLPVGMAGGYAFDVLSRVTGKTFPISAIRVRKFAAETTVGTTALDASGFRSPFAMTEALARTVSYEFPGGRVPEHPVGDLPPGGEA